MGQQKQAVMRDIDARRHDKRGVVGTMQSRMEQATRDKAPNGPLKLPPNWLPSEQNSPA
jgi:hypothetical protein